MQIGSLFAGIRDPLCSLAAFADGHFTGIDKFDRLHFAEPRALGIAVTNIAFQNPAIGGIKIHGAEGTDADT